jgi:hypothetical protein
MPAGPLDLQGKPVHATAHVRRTRSQPDPHARRRRNHPRRTATTRRSVTRLTLSPTLMAVPSPLRANEDETSRCREFRLEGTEGSSRTCPCSRHRLMPRLALPRAEAVGRRSWQCQPRHHLNYRTARAAGRSARRTSYASWPRPIAPLRAVGSVLSCVARDFTHRLSQTGEGSVTPGPSPHWFLANAARRLPNATRFQPK